MFVLTLTLLERVGLIILLANILMNNFFYTKIMSKLDLTRSKLMLIIIFGIFAVISNFTGVLIEEKNILNTSLILTLPTGTSIANTRVLPITISGLIGGPLVGIGVGIISGLVRLFQGGVNAYTYIISSLIIGGLSGILGKHYFSDIRHLNVLKGSLFGALMEIVQMICILIFYQNTSLALELVRIIAVPMILTNALGTGIFLSIIASTINKEEAAKAIQTHDVLELANQTLPYFRQGLTRNSSQKAAEIIQQYMHVSAVSITDTTSILAHIGAGSDHHVPTKEIITDLSKEVLQTGKIHIAHSKEEIGCSDPNCPLKVAIVIPLFKKDTVVGTFKLYYDYDKLLTSVDEQLSKGLGDIFSTQIELGMTEIDQRLLKDAEIKSLEAQINPHFLFNAINTISALIRINADQARDLLLQLSTYFRTNLSGHRHSLVTLEEELQHTEAYLSIEQARFPDKFRMVYDIDEDCLQALVPPFFIQTLVENAIKHGFVGRKSHNLIQVTAKQQNNQLFLSVADNGIGIAPNVLQDLGKKQIKSSTGTGSAVENLNKRLISLFGQHSQLTIETSDKGSQFSANLPFTKEELTK
ncbi:sensor histidine kinase [Vagococcus humatus]|uniref:histidine kinase n=1 Tax=Vagococcus humatus TaxID=1889241 RepID=A0A3R9ZWI3_9ENTE|nr:sensor histidine kinase [Vagococcus humatus]RST89411.1 sensor histidine kinase [Vagococcus humatus]